jgi:predicted nucleic acid-binding Zn ribbon protein
MYCVNCGNALAQGLSYCSRCGLGLKERKETRNPTSIIALGTAITILGICGPGIMLGGALVLKKEALLSAEMIGFFMIFTFLLVGVTEVMLLRMMSRLVGGQESKQRQLPMSQPLLELQPPAATPYSQPIGSVTENTTRTLEYAQRER